MERLGIQVRRAGCDEGERLMDSCGAALRRSSALQSLLSSSTFSAFFSLVALATPWRSASRIPLAFAAVLLGSLWRLPTCEAPGTTRTMRSIRRWETAGRKGAVRSAVATAEQVWTHARLATARRARSIRWPRRWVSRAGEKRRKGEIKDSGRVREAGELLSMDAGIDQGAEDEADEILQPNSST